MKIPPKQLLNILIRDKIIDQKTAENIELEILKTNTPIEQYLLKEKDMNKKAIIKAIAEILKIRWVDVSSTAADPQALAFIPESIARKHTILPIVFDTKNQSILLATSDPFDLSLIDFLEKKTSKKIIPALADKEDILRAIDLSYSQRLSPEVMEALQELGPQKHIQSLEKSSTTIREAPIAKIVNTILEFAMKSRASDIHIESQETKTRVRYRIDGVLREKLALPKSIHDSLVSRIKILSEMKIDEKRIPQDGRFSFKLGDDEVDLRVSTLPTISGEKVVMRLLKKTGGLPSLTELGLQGPQLKDLEEAVSKPYGIILVTGPTGSGKTTTLYSVLSKLSQPTVNIVTLEDPVEYRLSGINQVQVNPQAGLTFSTGLRSFLRQDPNIILVGEIRDKETTQLAIQAALTGHLVFSTLHTNDAATSIPRLIDLGGEPFLIASVLNASIAQRIVRRVCKHCKQYYIPPKEVQDNIKSVLGDLLPKKYSQPDSIKLVKGIGCKNCNNLGYLGRIGIFEVLKISPFINKMILKELSGKEIEAQAIKEGLISMKQDGYLKALDNITTIEEILRVAEL